MAEVPRESRPYILKGSGPPESIEMSDLVIRNTSCTAASTQPGGGRRWLEFCRTNSAKWPRWKILALCITADSAATIIALSTTLVVNSAKGCGGPRATTTSISTPTTKTVPISPRTVTASPQPDPNFLPACWSNLMSICSNNTEVPKDRVSNGFGACSGVYWYFYRGLIVSLKDEGRRFCSNMRDFCARAEAPQSTAKAAFTTV
ncbi:hypothetical protein IFR04_004593 [Cadophora malorum]|uniref:Uncharacterized protein n=1 Tax=Cadophora malorum TaxID=108018 RepID=A0A8H8BSM9_9HELO|nr:hypothetical protein IFR04_004593 [Cadophora malorum]